MSGTINRRLDKLEAAVKVGELDNLIDVTPIWDAIDKVYGPPADGTTPRPRYMPRSYVEQMTRQLELIYGDPAPVIE